MDKILLTGASGFIGSHFIKNETRYRKVVRRKRTVDSNQNDIFEITTLDSQTDWEGAFCDIKSVIHLAGPAHKQFEYGYYEETILKGTIRLAKSAAKAGVKRFVFVSSVLVNGNSSRKGIISVASPIIPANDFAYFKHKTEVALQEIGDKYDMEIVIVRPTLVYGKGAPGNFSMLHRFVSLSVLSPFGCIKNKRNFISVYNLVDLLELCAEHPRASGKVFIASEAPSMSTKDFIDNIAKSLGRNIYHIPVPLIFFKVFGYVFNKSTLVENIVGNLEVDSVEAKEVLGWAPIFDIENFS
ncbi:NAD-dependent epimerase/dehydratase family protein [Vibrio tasmaniensis]|uniref:NAD-dependent epimerase/dehydratase family protein n=1 Tax=Vibrio tasmaniensis TaxID=212663 RepID=UPI00111928E4|nr:NAD-dependent epimerase/dehydratase family protein [Vibrio tasmaniensis]